MLRMLVQNMVHPEGKSLHGVGLLYHTSTQLSAINRGEDLYGTAPIPYSDKLENKVEIRRILIDELERWRSILSVKYENYKLENNISI